MASPVIEAQHVSKQFPNGTYALNQVTLTIHPGETLVLIGESGSGKTTFLRLLNRMEDPTAGTIRFHGRSILEENAVLLRRRLGYVQQDGGLLPHWTVERNVALVPALLHWDVPRCRRRVATLLEWVGLPPDEYRARYPSELSGGQRQRVAFARALAGNPDVVLLDEPFGALDALTRDDLHDQFLFLKRQLTTTMVLVTHDLHEAFRLGDRLAVMKDGQVLQVDTPAQLVRQPATDYVRALLKHRRRDWP